MRISLLLILLIGVSSEIRAQSDSSSVSKRQFLYFNNFLAGGLLGKSGQGSFLSLSTTHGIRIKRLALGAGVGFDSYINWKTLPLFGTLSYDLVKIKRNAIFIQFIAGYTDAWRIKTADWEPDYNISGGEVIGSIIGYRITAKQFSLYISAGHKFQQINYAYNPTPEITGQSESRISIEENINRLQVQIGFGLH